MTASKIVAAAASGAAGGATLDVDECFSCHLYDGTGSAQTITNNIDLTEGGLVWTKQRNTAKNHALMDTARGTSKYLISNTSDAENTGSTLVTSFNSNGYSIGTGGFANLSGGEYVSWTFRKAPNFFDVVTYSGTGSAQNINHSLGSNPGMIIIKSTSNSENWQVWHRSVQGDVLELDNTGGGYTSARITNANSNFFTLGTFNTSNGSGQTYVAYVFAHNNNDGGFGPDSDQDIIKCGAFTSDSNGLKTVNLGFEPQWLLFKGYHAGSSWFIVDVMRGMVNGANDAWLAANLTNAEGTSNTVVTPTATGFVTDGTNIVDPSSTFIYMAIRRGSLNVPEDATKVFSIDTQGSTTPKPPAFKSGFSVDFAIRTNTSTSFNNQTHTRLLGDKFMSTNLTDAEASYSTNKFDYQDGYFDSTTVNSSIFAWMWKRAPGYFDVVATKAVSTNNGDVNHNLGVKPEMAWYKRRDGTDEWYVATAINGYLVLDKSNAANGTASGSWLDAVGGAIGGNDATATTINSGYKFVGNASYDMIIYLFASAPGVSKVGSYTGNGSTQNIDCGFSSGARFVLTKCSSHTGAWHVFDTVRGIVSGNDPLLELDSTSAQSTSYDAVDPLSSGFTVSDNITNENGRTFIFYAIA